MRAFSTFGNGLSSMLSSLRTVWKNTVGKQRAMVARSVANAGGGVAGSLEEECDLQDDLYLKEIKSLSDDELAKELRSAFYGAFAAYKEGELNIYEEKLTQYHACEITYLERIGVDRSNTYRVRCVLNTLLCSSNVSKTDVVVSESLEVCAQVHAEASRDDGIIDVDTAEGQCVSNVKKVRSILNLLIDSCWNIAESADEDIVAYENADKVSSVLDPISDCSKVVSAESMRSV